MPLYMDGILAVGDVGQIKKGIKNCRKLEMLKHVRGLKRLKQ